MQLGNAACCARYLPLAHDERRRKCRQGWPGRDGPLIQLLPSQGSFVLLTTACKEERSPYFSASPIGGHCGIRCGTCPTQTVIIRMSQRLAKWLRVPHMTPQGIHSEGVQGLAQRVPNLKRNAFPFVATPQCAVLNHFSKSVMSKCCRSLSSPTYLHPVTRA